MTLNDIITTLPDEMKNYCNRFGLKDTILKFGEKDGTSIFIQTPLGNLVVDPNKLVSNRIHSDPKEGIWLLRAGKWQMLFDNLKVDI